MLPIINSYIRAKPQLLEEVSCNMGQKAEKTSAMEQNRFIQRNKKKVLRTDILRILVEVILRFNIKKVSFIFKILAPVYLRNIKTDIK